MTSHDRSADAVQSSMSTLPATDRAFVMDAANSGLAEIELSKLATDRAADPKVKDFARQMVADHTRINQQVADLASKHHIELAGQLTPKDMKNKAELAALSGKAFDERYVSDQVKDHLTVVGRYETQARQGQDPALKSFAESTLPTLRQHLEHAQSLANQINAGKPQ
jgi:putative membrane protein